MSALDTQLHRIDLMSAEGWKKLNAYNEYTLDT
jgi:hypothetical protein